MNLGFLLKIALEQANQQVQPDIIDVTPNPPPKPEPPAPPQVPDHVLREERRRGFEEGSHFGGTFFGFDNPFGSSKAPAWMTAPTPTDPVEAAKIQARAEGYQQGLADWQLMNSETSTDVALKTMRGVPKIMDWGAGKLNKGINRAFGTNYDWGAAQDWDHAKGLDDYYRITANERAEKFDPSTEAGREAMRQYYEYLGKTPWGYEAMRFAQEHPDSMWAPFARFVGGVEDFGNRALYQDSGINLALMAAPVKGIRPGLRVPAVIAGEAIYGAAPGVINAVGNEIDPRISMALGVDSRQRDEAELRRIYGDQFVTEESQKPFMGTWADEQGNSYFFSGSDIAPEARESSLPFFGDYMQYLDNFSIPREQMTDEANKMGYVMNRISAGTPGTEIFNTPMFRTLTSENQVKAFEDWAERRYINIQDADFMAIHGADSKAGMLSAALGADTTGVLRNGVATFFGGADIPTIVHFLDSHAAGGGGRGDTSALTAALTDAFTQNMIQQPDHIWPFLQGSLKVNAAQAVNDSKDPNVAVNGANMIRTAFKNVLADPSAVREMSHKDFVELVKALSEVYSSKDGPALLGEGGDELSQAATDNLQTVSREVLKEYPEYGPDFAKAYLNFNKMPGAAAIAGNPWVFWLGVAGLLFGGVALVSSVFDNDEDDEEEDEDLIRYEKALRRRIYS